MPAHEEPPALPGGSFFRSECKETTQINERLSLQRTTKSVIPSPEGAWESPVIQMLSVVITGDCHGRFAPSQ